MSFPICEECASSGILCEKCEERVRRGDVSEVEVLLSELLATHEADGFERIVELSDKLVIIASEKEALQIIGKKGKTVRELSGKLGRRIAVIAGGWDPESIAKSIARPNKLLTVNRVFKEDGKERLKLIFDNPLEEGTVNLLKELLGEIEIGHKDEKNTYMRRPLGKAGEKVG
jgi:transcription antitermination factor NusA-like protein